MYNICKIYLFIKNIFMMFDTMYKHILYTYIINMQAITTQLHRHIVYIFSTKKHIYEVWYNLQTIVCIDTLCTCSHVVQT
jgi:hypothetical protein